MMKTLFFDWHGVLDKRTFSGLIELVARTKNVPVKEMTRQMWDYGHQYALGILPPEEFWPKIKTEYKLSESEFLEARSYILTVERNEDIWSMLPELESKYRLCVFSDCPRDKADVIRRTQNLSLFERAYFSCDISLDKSNPEFFVYALEDLGEVEEAIFIDDSRENVDYVKTLRMQALLYTPASDLRKQLLG